MKLKDLDNDELLIFYFLLDGNEKYNTISSLKKAILSRMNFNNMNYINSILRGICDE